MSMILPYNPTNLVGHCLLDRGANALAIEAHRSELFRGVAVVGLTGGTSTLPETVEAVRRRLEEFHD